MSGDANHLFTNEGGSGVFDAVELELGRLWVW
jgi:hypothetical protein